MGVNALVGALRGYSDDSRHWDIVGVSVFALLMGLGGGFIRDMLLGNLPATSLRDPWSLATVLVADRDRRSSSDVTSPGPRP